MKVNDFENWKRIVFDDRVVLKSDLINMSEVEREALLNTEVSYAVGREGYPYSTLYVSTFVF